MTVTTSRSRTTPRSRTAVRVTALAGALALAVLTLSGCLKIAGDVTVSSDATGSGTLSFELQKQAASLLGISDLDAFKAQVMTGDMKGQGLDAFTACETSENDTAFVYTCTFTDQTFTDPSGIWTITKTGKTITFHMVNAGQLGTEGSDASALLGDASLGTVTVKATFPGAITSVTGAGAEKTSDTTATINGTMTSPLDVTITSESGSSGLTTSALLVLVGAVAVLALIVIVIVVLLVRRRKRPQPALNVNIVGTDNPVPVTLSASAEKTTSEAVVLDDAGAPTEVQDAPAEAPVETAPEPTADDDPSI